VSNHVKGVKALFRARNLKLELAYSLSKRGIYKDRSPTPEELATLIDLADVRVIAIISMLALGGFRAGTLVKLQYRHVKHDLEKGITPVHIHVEAEITKGKYHDYDTFLGQEAAEYLTLYLQARRQGTEKMPPENIHDETPLIRNMQLRRPVPITPTAVHQLIHELYQKAGLIPQKSLGRRYDLRVHSFRKFFRTQLAALGTPTDYIEYMMGHTISTYHDLEMKGIEYLRGIYSASALSIKPKTRVSKIDALKEIIRAWGLNPEEILTKEALARPNATVIGRERLEERQLHQLSIALKGELLKEIREEQHSETKP
jgi:integrase